ncbi:hypothetical protein ABPG75_008099 [Micractinium tetrahymenae]
MAPAARYGRRRDVWWRWHPPAESPAWQLTAGSPAGGTASFPAGSSSGGESDADHKMEEIKERKQKMEAVWEAAAAKYAEWVIDNHAAQGIYPEFAAFLEPLLRGKEGVRILDVASASGEPAATLAAALPNAQVLSTDLAHAYLQLGKSRAARLGLQNIAFETADAEDLHRYPDASFDAVTCSLGLMFMPSDNAALREFARVLKPGGVFVATLWQAQEQVPFFELTLKFACEYDPDMLKGQAVATALRYADPTGLIVEMQAAGLGDVQKRTLQVEFFMPAHAWWREMLEMPLPIKPSLEKAQEARPGEDVFEEGRQKMQRRLQEKGWLDEEETVHIKGNGCWFITAKKA